MYTVLICDDEQDIRNALRIYLTAEGYDVLEAANGAQALEMLEESWYTMAKTFPQVKIWEIGNEWNLNAFLHPDGFLDSDMSKPFTANEKMDIAVDMQYFAARGIRRSLSSGSDSIRVFR